MALWGVVAVVFAVKLFKWEPSKGSGRKSRKAKKAEAAPY
jgi:hypothetical protein